MVQEHRSFAAPTTLRMSCVALLFAGMFVSACGDDSTTTTDASAGSDAGVDAAALDSGAQADGTGTGSDGDAMEGGSAADAAALGGCIDRVGSDNHVATIINSPNGTCDTYGSFTLTTAAGGPVNLTHATFFRTDQTGTNAAASDGHINRGVWTSEAGAQNIPGNYVAHLFIATTANPGPGDFVALGAPGNSTVSLSGTQTFYFFADSDDQAGGSYGFGLNLWFAATGAPALSTFVAVPGGTFAPDATTGCTPSFDGTCAVGANALSTTSSGTTVTLSAFTVGGLGGATAPAPVDAGASD